MKKSSEALRTGVALWPGTPSRVTIRIAKLADQNRLDSIWVTESTLAPGRDAISLLGALSAITKKLRLGTGIINIFTRTPTLIASTAATLDELSNGRTILGLGTGHLDPLAKWHSVRFEKPLTRMKEHVELIRALLPGGPVSYHGRTVAVDDLQLSVNPSHQIPIYMATVGPQMAALAGRIADGALVTMNTLAQLRRLLSVAQESALDSGRKIDLAAYVVSFISQDSDANIRAARRVLAMYCAAPYYNKAFADAGYEKEALAIAEFWKNGARDRAYELVSDRMVEGFAALGVDETVKRVEEYRATGVTLPIVALVYMDGLERSASRLFSELTE